MQSSAHSLLRSLVIDNDPSSRASLSEWLSRHPQVNRVDQCEDCLTATDHLGRTGIDIAFMNIGLKELNGIEQLLRLPKSRLPRFTFMSSSFTDERHQFRTPSGVEIEILPRSASGEQLNSLLTNNVESESDADKSQTHDQLRFIIEHCGGTEPAGEKDGQTISPYLQRLLIKNGNDSRLIAAGRIDWVESADHYVYLHVGGKSHLLYATMNDLQERLPPGRFIRAHRGAIINVDSVRKVTNGKYGTLLVTLADDSEVRVSRSRREEVRKSLSNF